MEAVETEGNHAKRHGHGPRGTHGIHAARSVEGQTGRARAPDAVAGETLAWRRLCGPDAHDRRVLRHVEPGVRRVLAVRHRHGPAGRGGAGRAKPDDGCRRVLRPDQLVQGRHHQTALYVPARPAGHRQEHVRAPRGAGTERPGHERDHPRRSEARLRLTGQHARRPGHPAGSGHRRGQPPGPRRPPLCAATLGGQGAQGPDGLLQRHEGGAHGGAFDDHAHRPRGRRRGRCQGRDRTRIRYPFRGRARAPRPARRRPAASRHRGPARPAARRARRGAYGGGLGRPGKTTSSTGRRFAAFWPTCTDSRTA